MRDGLACGATEPARAAAAAGPRAVGDTRQTPVPPGQPQGDAVEARWPRLWRGLVIGACTLILCSCRGPVGQRSYDPGSYDPALIGQGELSLPEEAYTGAPVGYHQPAAAGLGPAGMEQAVPLAQEPAGPWAPPGISQPWPRDEYLRDGGDAGTPAGVLANWEVRGLELEDTIAHYDTIDGQRVVEPTNRVHIYSPRFGVVRKVQGLESNQQQNRPADVRQTTRLAAPASTQLVATSKQNIQPLGQAGSTQLAVFQSRQFDDTFSGAYKAAGFDGGLMPHETGTMIREDSLDSAEMAFIARGVAAATVWSRNQAVQVTLNGKVAAAEAGAEGTGSIHTVDEPLTRPKLQVLKLASTQVAQPGDEVEFTIYFDNVGTEVIGNVTIIDNLTTRLEYIPQSAKCSIDASFSTQPNEGGSLVIRCELSDPLAAGQGGVIRFRCRVR